MSKIPRLLFISILICFLTACQSNSDGSENTGSTESEVESQPRNHPAALGTKRSNVHTNVDGRTNKIVTAHLDVGGMEWITLDQASEMKNTEGKKFLVDVYTDWCGWCKVMDKKTFGDSEVKKYLEENYHLVKFNAEQTDPIHFKNKTYKWAEVGRNGINTLAMEILGNQMSYPTLVYFDENLNKIKASPGYKGPDQLLAELKGMDN